MFLFKSPFLGNGLLCRHRRAIGKAELDVIRLPGYNALGKTEAGRFLSVFFIKKFGNNALIVTARDMNKSERKRYGKK